MVATSDEGLKRLWIDGEMVAKVSKIRLEFPTPTTQYELATIRALLAESGKD